MKIAVIGANGQLGKDISLAFAKQNDDVIELTHQDIEISDIDSVATVLKSIRPEAVVNTAAMHHVEQCEENPVHAYEVNGLGAKNLAELCIETGAALMHISTDYVFDGKKEAPYIENDRPLPLNVYGNTKLSGECFIESADERFYILRVSAIYGKTPCRAKGSNFVQLMLRLAKERDKVSVVDDETVSPTHTVNIADQIVRLIQGDAQGGLYHATSEGCCTWYEFAREIFLLSKADVILKKAGPGEFPMKVNRPKYSVLENRCLTDHGLNIMPHWKDALKEYLNTF